MADRQGPPRELDVLTRRIELLERLCDGPAHKRDLVEEMDDSRSTINRAVGELEDVNLVERGSDGFEATVAGRLALERHGEFRREIDDIVDAEAVVGPLPSDAPIDVEAVTGSEATVSAEPAPYRPLERIHDRIADARRYRALLPVLDDPRRVRILYEHVVTHDRAAELIVTPELFDTLRTEFPRRMAAMADSGSFRVLVADVPPFAVGLVDVGIGAVRGETTVADDGSGRPDADPGGTVTIVVFNEHGGVHGVLENPTADAIRWAEGRYREIRTDAVDRTDALQADADGGTRAVHGEGVTGISPTGDTLPVALEREGFVGLDASFFRDEPVADPTTAWRSGLTLPEVHTGYAVERTRRTADAGAGKRSDDADGRSDDADGRPDDVERPVDDEEMTAALRSALESGSHCVVVGPPGSGKSTTCKQVACRWYGADRGPVLYREGGRGRPFETVEDLALAADAAAGHALVVVEDAVRPDADAVFGAIDRLGDRGDVSFLLDARESEWRHPPGDPVDGNDLEVLNMPPLADRDCERLVQHFERTVGETVDVPVDRLREEVRDEATAGDDAAPGEVLLLLHRLATYADPLADGRTSLEEAVAGVYDDLARDDLALSVCVLANALNAAGLAVDAGALYPVADPGEYAGVDDALDRLEGRVLFPRDDGSYRTVHETWSVTFLAHLLEVEGKAAAADRFGDCLSALLALADAADVREAIVRHRGGRRPLAAVVDDPAGWVDETVEAVYALGRERPKLAPLFGDGERDSVELPAARSEEVAGALPVWLGRMFLAGGYYDRAERAFGRLSREETDQAVERLLGLARVAGERGEFDDAVDDAEECLALVENTDRAVVRARAKLEIGRALTKRTDYERARRNLDEALARFEALGERRRKATVLDQLGEIATSRGAYGDAREHHRRSLAVSRDLGDRRGEANSLNDLGAVSFSRGRYDQAREYFERSLDIVRALGDRQGEADIFNRLGWIASNLGEYGEAREYHERALDVYRELGNRHGEAVVLGNLGLEAERQGEYDQARENLERSLELFRAIGDNRGVATRNNNLGLVAVRQGELDQAREYFQQGLDIARETGTRRREANALNGLGHVDRMRGEFDRAREYHERALDVTQDVGFRRREADSLNKLGLIADHRGAYDQARTYYERAREIAREIGHPREEAKSSRGLGAVARHEGDYGEAGDQIERALEVIEPAGNRIETAQVRLAAGRLALSRGDVDQARELAEQVRGSFEEMGTIQWAGRSRRLLGRVAAEEGDPDAARDHWGSALETFEDVGAPQDALATLELLVGVRRVPGDVDPDDADPNEADQAERWCERAGDLLARVPDPVADEHREWVRRQCSDVG